jgi:hypothetical protein
MEVQPQARPPVPAPFPAQVPPLERVPLQAEVRPRALVRLAEVSVREPAQPREVLLQGQVPVRPPAEVQVRGPVEVPPQVRARVPRQSAVAGVRCRPFAHRAKRPQ